MEFPRKSISRVAIIVGLMLVIPVLGNLFVEGWNWGVVDFVVMGTLLFITGLAIDWVARTKKSIGVKIIGIVAIIGVLLLIWIELAVDAVSRGLNLLFG